MWFGTRDLIILMSKTKKNISSLPSFELKWHIKTCHGFSLGLGHLCLHPSLLVSPASLPSPVQATGSVHTSINTGPAGRSANYRFSSFPHSDLGLIFLDLFPPRLCVWFLRFGLCCALSGCSSVLGHILLLPGLLASVLGWESPPPLCSPPRVAPGPVVGLGPRPGKSLSKKGSLDLGGSPPTLLPFPIMSVTHHVAPRGKPSCCWPFLAQPLTTSLPQDHPGPGAPVRGRGGPQRDLRGGGRGLVPGNRPSATFAAHTGVGAVPTPTLEHGQEPAGLHPPGAAYEEGPCAQGSEGFPSKVPSPALGVSGRPCLHSCATHTLGRLCAA